jgi:hypothetical protein
MHRLATAIITVLVLCGQAIAQEKGITVTVTVDKIVSAATPVCVPLSLPKDMASWDAVTAIANAKTTVQGQLTAPGVLTDSIKPSPDNLVRRDLHFVVNSSLLDATTAKKAGTFTLRFKKTVISKDELYFSWKNREGRFADLMRQDTDGNRHVLRYMYQAYDPSTADNRNLTYKVFHHLYDVRGRQVTNGGHNDNPKVLQKFYPHHRGIQMGFNKCSYGEGLKKKADVWHCQKDDHQSHEGFLNAEAGNVLGRHRVAVDWHGAGKEVFVKEERELTVYKTPSGRLVEFAARLKPVSGTVKLDGDPQHAGFQFRAHNDVFEKTSKQTYYLRPDGKGKLGETRNWGDKKSKIQPVNLPWNAMSFVLDDKRYTVCYLDHPNNPRESRHSERDYGRFGCYFEKEITPERPLVLNYRLWLQDGEMMVEDVQALYDSFASPPKTAAN